MLIQYGIKDKVSGCFVDYKFGKELPQVTRVLSHFVNGEVDKTHPYCLDTPDYELYQLGSIDEQTGLITSEFKFELNLTALKKSNANK